LQPLAARLLALSSSETGQRRLRQACTVVLLFWIANSLLRALWSFVPPAAPLPGSLQPINPALQDESRTAQRPVSVAALLEAELFGAPGAPALPEAVTESPVPLEALTEAQAATELAGIEDGAPPTRLPLLLRGVVAASEAGLGQAVIEHRKQQELYRVGDDLPAGNEVKLAKVMPTQVVISNGGRYELLRLFDDTGSIGAVPAAPLARPAAAAAKAASVPATAERSRIASAYREQLYRDPKSLADVVRIAAVRRDGELVGYRVNPGRAAQEFETLGFRPGDLVTSVNGLSLSDPANTVRLYQTMRSASEAVFDVKRGEETISLTVRLGGQP